MHGKMLAAIQSVYTDTSVAMKINGHYGSIHSPSVDLCQGCELSATLFGLFFDGRNQHLQASAPDAGIKVQHLRLTDMEYADDVFLLASTAAHLQALIDPTASYCEDLHMQVSTEKTKVMIIGSDTAESFACNSQPLEQMTKFKYLGLHFPPVRTHFSSHHTHYRHSQRRLGCNTACTVTMW